MPRRAVAGADAGRLVDVDPVGASDSRTLRALVRMSCVEDEAEDEKVSLTSASFVVAETFVEFILQKGIVRVVGMNPAMMIVEKIEQKVISWDGIVKIGPYVRTCFGQLFGSEFVQFFDVVLGEMPIQLVIIDDAKR